MLLDDKVQPLPEYSYQDAVSKVMNSPATTVIDSDAALNSTSLVDEQTYLSNYNGDHGFELMEILSERYSIVLLVTCTVIPLIFSWLQFLPLPLPQPIVSKFYAYFIDAPVFGSYHAVPVLGLGFVPTRGQMLFIVYIWIVNIILSSVGYELTNPNSWFFSTEKQLVEFISNRVGTLSFVNLALAVLNSSRNSFLLYLTNGSHSTFLLVHRWIAVICMLQACLYSAIWLQIYLNPLSGSAFAIWAFDRFLARPFKLARNGVKNAYISIIDEDYMMIEIPGIEAEGEAYLYFPTLTWRVWESHPFTVAAISGRSVLGDQSPTSNTSSRSLPSEILQKGGFVIDDQKRVIPNSTKAPGVVFFVRRRGGLTAQLAKHTESAHGIRVLVKSSYGAEISIVQSPTSRPSIEYPNLICVIGGVGITAALPILNRVPTLLSPGKTKPFWGVRTDPLVQAVENLIGVKGSSHGKNSIWGGMEVAISVGKRFNLKNVLELEIQGMGGGTTVVVCGPRSMADDVRSAVTGLGRKGVVVRLLEESFSW